MSWDTETEYEPPTESKPAQPIAVAPPVAPVAAMDLPALARLARELGPRDERQILERARTIGAQLGAQLPADPQAESTGAYYRWTIKGRDGRSQVIEGPSIDLMDALAGEWGRLVYRLEIVAEYGTRVQLKAQVIDLVTLVIHERPYLAALSPPPAKFARNPAEQERWRVMQLQSAESKAIRGVLERVIPAHVQEAALASARDAAAGAALGTIKGSDGKPRRATLPEAIAAATEALASISCPIDLTERWIGKPRSEWIARDLGAVRALFRGWRAGELTAARLEEQIRDRELAGERDEGSSAPSNGAAPSADERGLGALGLGPTGTSTPTSTSTTGAAPATALGSPAGSTASSRSGTPTAAAPATTKAPAADRRQIATDRLAQLRADHPQLVEELGRPVGKITARTAVAQIEWLVAAVEREVEKLRGEALERARAPAPDPAPGLPLPPEPGADEWTGPVGAELVAEVHSLARDLGPDLLKAALRHAGIPQIDGAPEPALRRVLEHLLGEIPTEGT